MKKSNKSWVRQLSESYIRQALNESDFHQEIDDEHARFAPEDAGRIKQILDAHASKHGPFADKTAAVDHIVNKYPHLNPRTGEGRQLSAERWAEHLEGIGRSTFPSNDSSNDTYQGY